MTRKYVCVAFTRQETTEVVAQVETELSGVALKKKVAIPHEWMKRYFGDEWETWEVEGVTEITDDWSILKNRSTDAALDREFNEAPLFEIADDEGQEKEGA